MLEARITVGAAMKRLLLLGFVFVLGVGAGIATTLSLIEESPQPTRVLKAFSPVPREAAAKLAQRFRPWLRFDDKEPWRPVNIDALLAERNPNGASAHRVCSRPTGRCEPVTSESEFVRLIGTYGETASLDLAGNRLSDYHAPDTTSCPGLSDCGVGPSSAIYYRVTSANRRYYIDYWWFLRFNHVYLSARHEKCLVRIEGICDEHEGDWEGVTVVTPPGEDDDLDYVVYAAHKETFRYSGEQLALKNGTRPEVYVARGTHASYPQACAGLVCEQKSRFKGVANIPETSFDGQKPWARNTDRCVAGATGSCLQPLPRPEFESQTWTAWPGLWGATCGSRCGQSHDPQSPQSPGRQPRYQAPWCSTAMGVWTCDGSPQTCDEWLVPLVAALACNPQALTAGLRAVQERPSGGPVLVINPSDGSASKVSSTTPGIVQGLADPLKPGSRVTIAGRAPADEQLLVRARQGRYVVEARFDHLGLEKGGTREVEITGDTRLPIVRIAREGRTPQEPTEQRIIRLPPIPTPTERGGKRRS
jgi:hypothetical protein